MENPNIIFFNLGKTITHHCSLFMSVQKSPKILNSKLFPSILPHFLNS